MEREQVGGGKVKRKKVNEQRIEAGIEDINAMTLSMAEEANAFSAGDNRACSNGGSGEDEYSSSKGTRAGAKTGSRSSS